MYCNECGNQVNDNSSFCEKCGHRISTKNKKGQTNTWALIGLILAAISIFINLWGLVGICAVIFSVVGLTQINNSNEVGKGIAISGIIIGTFSIIYAFVMIMLVAF